MTEQQDNTSLPEEPQVPVVADAEIADIDELVETPAGEKEEVKPSDDDGIPVRKQHNVTVDRPWSNPEIHDDQIESLSFPADLEDQTRYRLSRMPNVNMIEGSKVSDEWAPAVNDSLSMQQRLNVFEESFEREGSDWKQGVDFNNARFAGGAPKVNKGENQNLQGERAVIRMMTHLGLGSLHTEPLWHSGLWLTFKSPTETEIIELNRQLFQDKIEFGRYTHGLAFSNVSSYMTDRLVDFALDHVYTTTMQGYPANDGSRGLKNFILSQDIPAVLIGLLNSMYVKGFKYRRACTADPEKCMHVIEEMINLSKLHFVDNAALTERQKIHMSDRQRNSKTEKEIRDYQAESVRTRDFKIEFSKGEPHAMEMFLKTPNIAEYVEAGYKWIDGITNLVEQAIAAEPDKSGRERYVQLHGQATLMRQYSHWVRSIHIESTEVTDRNSIENMLGVMSADNLIRNKFTEEVIKYINNSTFAVVGIPAFDCPECGKDQAPEDAPFKNFKNVIPLDVIQVFFGLLTQRVAKITER